MSHETRLNELGIELPPAGKSLGVYKPVLVAGNFAYPSGHGPVGADGTAVCGRLGDDLDQAAGFDAARRTGLRGRACVKEVMGDSPRGVGSSAV